MYVCTTGDTRRAEHIKVQCSVKLKQNVVDGK